MKTCKVSIDYNHPELTKKILNSILLDKTFKNDEAHRFNAVPKIKKPFFWQFKKIKEYKKECDSIFENYLKWKKDNIDLALENQSVENYFVDISYKTN